jgi:hypothetical protein
MISEPPIVILAPRMTDDSKAVWRTCLELGWSPERMQGWRVPENLVATDRPIIIYGEPLFAEAICDQIGLMLLEPPIDWLTTVPREYLARDIKILTLEEARRIQTEVFVKPADGKIFEPRVYFTGFDLPTGDHVDQDIPVLCSGVVHFSLEVRCFVRGRTIVTLSPYWRDGELATDADGQWPFLASEETEALDFAKTVLADPRVAMPPAWAIIESMLGRRPLWMRSQGGPAFH